ncbi:hypothetical protein CVS40_11698 [Lucilia cuprina]|nr:hypothetical protein CVS40_11698 [Lucilia cuprina]
MCGRFVESDGAVIRTPSVAEKGESGAANEKFGEVGLEVSVNDKLGPKRIHPEISLDEFMGELYDLNYRRRMTPEEFKRSARLVSAPGSLTRAGKCYSRGQ